MASAQFAAVVYVQTLGHPEQVAYQNVARAEPHVVGHVNVKQNVHRKCG